MSGLPVIIVSESFAEGVCGWHGSERASRIEGFVQLETVSGGASLPIVKVDGKAACGGAEPRFPPSGIRNERQHSPISLVPAPAKLRGKGDGMKSKLRELIGRILRFLGVVAPSEVDYIGTGDTLPSPMTPEEEARALKEYAAGSEEARLKLIERNLRLVVYIAKRFDNTGVDIEDLISIGTIGLIKAVGSFRPDKNIKVSSRRWAASDRTRTSNLPHSPPAA